MLATTPMPFDPCSTPIDWAPVENTPTQFRRIVIAIEDSAESVEAQLIRHVFDEANRVPDIDREYVIELVPLEDTETNAPPAGRWLSEERDPAQRIDTIFVTGSYEQDSWNVRSSRLNRLKRQCERSRRIVAVAGGTLYLAAMELLNGKAAVSHWSMHDLLENTSSKVSVRSDILYTQDGNIYTCAGALASVDLALRLIEEDLGSVVSSHIARRLLVPFQRTAICLQISSTLRAQVDVKHPIADLLAWLPDQLTGNLSISILARRVAMSPRNFARRFREQVKTTPSRYLEDLRFEAAKRELFREGESISDVAARSGFKNVESLRRLFQRRMGMTPKAFRDQALGVPTHTPRRVGQETTLRPGERKTSTKVRIRLI